MCCIYKNVFYSFKQMVKPFKEKLRQDLNIVFTVANCDTKTFLFKQAFSGMNI